jgi:hypothetical protein
MAEAAGNAADTTTDAAAVAAAVAAADAAAPPLYELGHAPLEDAPDRVLQLALQHLSAKDLCAARLVSQRLNEQATEGPLWTKLARRIFPADAGAVLEGGGGSGASSGAATPHSLHASIFAPSPPPPTPRPLPPPGPTAPSRPMRKFALWTQLQRAWLPPPRERGARFRGRLYRQQVSGDALFCTNALGGEEFLCAGAEGVVRVVGLTPRPAAELEADEAAASASARPRPPPRRFVAAVRGRFKAHDSGMLGMAVDKEARLVLTGSFSGESSLWRLTERRRDALSRLSVKALKEALAQHRLPSEGLFEKAELVDRLVLHLPMAEKLVDLAHHRGGETVVSTAVWRDVVITGSRDCTAKVSRIVEAAGGASAASAAAAFARSGRSFSGGSGGGSRSASGPSAFSLAGPAVVPWGAAADRVRIPIAPTSLYEPVKYEREWRFPAGDLVAEQIAELTADAPIDVVHLDPRFGRVLTGDKGGEMKVFDLAAGGVCTNTYRQGDCWLWVVKSSATWASTMGHEPGAPRFGIGERGTAEGGGSRSAAAGGDGEGEEGLEDDEELEQVAEGVWRPVRASEPVRLLQPENSGAAAAADSAYLGDGSMVLTGNTLGEIRLYDLRAAAAVQRVRIAPDAMRGSFHGGGAPITGIQPDFVHNRFSTSSFDGAMRVFDLRTFRPALVIACFPEGDDSGRLARVDITPAVAASGGMDGALYLADFLGDDARHEASTAQ